MAKSEPKSSKNEPKRKIDVDGIRPLPEELYKEFYGEDYDPNTWKLRFSGLSQDEKRTLRAYLKVQDVKEIYWVPEVNCPEGVHTADLYIDRVRVEIKNATTNTSIRTHFSKSAKQLEKGGILLFGADKSELSSEEFIGYAKEAGKGYSINGFAVARDDKLIAYEKRNPRTAGYPAHDPGVSSKNVPKPQMLDINDLETSYTSILPQNGKKVKTLDKLMKEPASDQVKAPTPEKVLASTKSPAKPSTRISKTSAEYWTERAEDRLTAAEKHSDVYLRQIQTTYTESAKKIIESVRDMYRAYYKRSDHAFDIPALEKIAPRGSISQFKADMKAAGLSTYLPENFQGRMTRAELLNAQIWGEVKKAALQENTISSNAYRDTIKDSYYRTIYDTAKGTGEVLAFSTLDTKAVEAVLSTKFYGKHYSDRIWNNTDRLASTVQEVMSQALATGQSTTKTVQEIRERFSVGKYEATRLVRTETAYFQNLSTIEAYKEMGFERYEFHATKDGKTCTKHGMCRDLDGKVFKLSEAKPGVNMPVLHPYCRCYITAYFGKEWEPEKMRVRDQDGKSVITEYKNYNEWRKMVEKDKNNSKEAKNGKMSGTKIPEHQYSLRDIFSDITPGRGNIIVESSQNNKRSELEQANWLKQKIGGEYTVLAESREQGVHTPDIMRNTDVLIECKSFSSLGSADGQVRYSSKQLSDEELAKNGRRALQNPKTRIVLLHTSTTFSNEEFNKIISEVARRQHRQNVKHGHHIDWVIVRCAGRKETIVHNP